MHNTMCTRIEVRVKLKLELEVKEIRAHALSLHLSRASGRITPTFKA